MTEDPSQAIYDMVTTVVPLLHSANPRGRQKALGPSEIGVECDLRLAYGILDWPSIRDSNDPLPSIVGTATHKWFADQFGILNEIAAGDKPPADRTDRYLVEHEISIPGTNIKGHVDLYDRHLRTSIDWKFKGTAAIKDARDNGPSEQYRVQGQLYAYGLAAAGELVEHVSITYFSRGGFLRSIYVWTEPYDERIAIAALKRLEWITSEAVRIENGAGTEFRHIEQTKGAACFFCKWHLPESTDLTKGCPGEPSRSTKALMELVAE